MASDGQIVFEVTADGKHAIADIKDITKAIQQESKKWDDAAEKSTDNISNSFNGMLKKLVAGFSAAKIGKALLDLGKDALEAASALEEVQNVVDVTFGSDAGKIDQWAKNAGTQFGLTETQAKKFTSTLGAMMKSAGMSGNEITEMSTDLAGLAADMASFYNLDFEEAFAKIRSGISGETEPLKQLGINMSVANLEAYALSKGITKAFNDMSQGEQTMLRYQYLMSATADAQGDFARTMDGFANSKRAFETSIESIKTKLGEFLIGPATEAVTWISNFLDEITKEPGKTVLDRFNEIEIDTQGKLAEIQKVADDANAIIQTLNLIGATDAGEAIRKIAEGANKLDSSSPGTWSSIFGSLKQIDGLSNIFTNNSAGKNVEDLAAALSESDVDTDKAEAWQIFLGALSENADAVSKLTGSSVEETKAWLESLSSAVNSIDAGDADAWDKLLTTLVQGFSADTPEGQKFIEGLATQFLSLGTDSETAVKGLEALGFSTDQISDKQKEWLKYCKQLVQTIPGLNEVINTETGEIKGGTGALTEYVEEWKATQEKLAYWNAYYAKKEAQEEANAQLYSLRIEALGADEAVKDQMNKIRQLYKKYGIREDLMPIGTTFKTYGQPYSSSLTIDQMRELNGALLELETLQGNATVKTDKYNNAVKDNAEAIKTLEYEEKGLTNAYGELTEAETNATDAQQEYLDSVGKTKEEVQTLAQTALDAVTAMLDYAEIVHDSMAKAVESTVKGFDKLDTYSKKLSDVREKVHDLAEEQAKYDKESPEWKNIQKQIDEANASVASRGSMLSALVSQKEFMEEYLANLEAAQKLGLSNELLASLSDGSKESAEYLAALVHKGEDTASASEIDAMYQKVQEKKKELTDALTEQQLTVDEVYQALADDAKKAVEALDLEGEAKNNTDKTVTGVLTALKGKLPDIADAVDAILTEIDKLAGLNIGIDFGAFSSVVISKPNTRDTESVTATPLAVGMDYVPYDGYLAALHQGESVLTAEENRIWQRFKNGGSGTDYDMMGNVMRDNIKPGGNVYLDGRIVGNVISEQQGRSYRQLQRSGWQG